MKIELKKKSNINVKAVILVWIVLVIVTFGITYAFFSYNRVGKEVSQLITGDVYMHYRDVNYINVDKVMPSEDYDPNNYFEFTISGKNTTTNNDIWYEIVLNHGPDHNTRTERIKDELLLFRLVEVNDGVESELFTKRNYGQLSNKRIWVDTIDRNTTSEIEKTYRLYMWIGDYTIIGETGENEIGGSTSELNPLIEDYTYDIWNEVYASVRVDVTGNFTIKSIETPSACFQYNLEYNEEIFNYVSSATVEVNNNLSDEQLNTCATYFVENIWGETADSETYADDIEYVRNLCSGMNSEYTFENFINDELMDGKNVNLEYLKSNGIINNYELERMYYDSITQDTLDINTINKEKAGLIVTKYDELCGVDVIVPSEIDGIDIIGFEGFASIDYYGFVSADPVFQNIKSIVLPDEIKYIGIATFAGTIAYEINNPSLLRNIIIPDNVMSIGPFAFALGKIRNIAIPNSVEEIGDFAFYQSVVSDISFDEISSLKSIGNDAFIKNRLYKLELPNGLVSLGERAFSRNRLSELIIPDTTTTIEANAFSENNLISVKIPSSLSVIEKSVFSSNQLTSITIPENITEIGDYSFMNNHLTTISVPDSVIDIGKYAFSGNNIKSINIGNGIKSIGENAFEKSLKFISQINSSNPNLSDIIINRACDDIKILSRYPWLSRYSPYTAEGVTIYGANGEICDVY